LGQLPANISIATVAFITVLYPRVLISLRGALHNAAVRRIVLVVGNDAIGKHSIGVVHCAVKCDDPAIWEMTVFYGNRVGKCGLRTTTVYPDSAI
jgi:hypothetical protein